MGTQWKNEKPENTCKKKNSVIVKFLWIRENESTGDDKRKREEMGVNGKWE